MGNFNYQKAYCVLAVPAFTGLPDHVKQAHAELLPLVQDLGQDRLLNTPLNKDIEAIFDRLTTKEIAEMSRASYFVGQWYPGILPCLFDTGKGQYWKVSNCADQILRQRLSLPYNIQVHEGKLRVTFSNLYSWLWEEFSLATEENLQIFEDCGLPFDESTIKTSAKALAAQIGDMWPEVDTVEDNDLYRKYITLSNKQADTKNRAKVAALIPEAEKAAAKGIEEARTETTAYTWLLDNGFSDLDNVIYYSHTRVFCFGWRKPLTKDEKSWLLDILCEFPFDYKLK